MGPSPLKNRAAAAKPNPMVLTSKILFGIACAIDKETVPGDALDENGFTKTKQRRPTDRQSGTKSGGGPSLVER